MVKMSTSEFKKKPTEESDFLSLAMLIIENDLSPRFSQHIHSYLEKSSIIRLKAF